MSSCDFDDMNKGFTLIELMISLTIIGVILLIVFGAFRIGIRAWEHGEADIVDHQRQRVILQRLKQQLASTYVNKIDVQSGEKAYFFKGDEAGLEFVSDAALIPGNDFGRVYVKYVVETDPNNLKSLWVYEKNLIFINTDLKGFSPDRDMFRVLLSDIKNFSFEFLKIDEDQRYNWFQAWDMNKDRGIPDAVRFAVQMDDDTQVVHVLARIIPEAQN